jgi:hypothetical protein
VASALVAQTPNDVGTNPRPEPLVPGNPEGGPIPGCETCPPTGQQFFTFDPANTQLGRIFRDGIATTCANKPYPGNFNPATTYLWGAETYHNFGPAACITINWITDVGGANCGVEAHGHVYSPTYDPTNQGANFLGDVGSSVTQPFMVTVPADTDFVVVGTNTGAVNTCTYGYEVIDVPCQTDPGLCQIPVELQKFNVGR